MLPGVVKMFKLKINVLPFLEMFNHFRKTNILFKLIKILCLNITHIILLLQLKNMLVKQQDGLYYR